MLIDDQQWKFRHTSGLADYFILHPSLKQLDPSQHKVINRFHHCAVPERHSYNDYVKYITEFYVLNNDVKQEIEKYTRPLPKKYSSIFVRWGDKLVSESQYIPCEIYMARLVKEGVKSGNLFIHSDDHQEVLKFKEYIQQNKLPYVVYSITDERDNGGAIVHHSYKDRMRTPISTDKKSVDEMSPAEIRDHTIRMLAALEIMKKSKITITDYQSNVSRFMKLYFPTPVRSVLNVEPVNYDAPAVNPSFAFRLAV